MWIGGNNLTHSKLYIVCTTISPHSCIKGPITPTAIFRGRQTRLSIWASFHFVISWNLNLFSSKLKEEVAENETDYLNTLLFSGENRAAAKFITPSIPSWAWTSVFAKRYIIFLLNRNPFHRLDRKDKTCITRLTIPCWWRKCLQRKGYIFPSLFTLPIKSTCFPIWERWH